MMGNKIVEYLIRAKADISSAAKSVNSFGSSLKSRFEGLSSWVRSTWAGKMVGAVRSAVGGIGSAFKSVFSNLMNIKAGFDMLATGVRTVGNVIKKGWSVVVEAMKDETAVRQLEMLTGSLEEAKKQFEIIKELGMTPPFSKDAFMDVTRSLHKFSGGLLNTKEMLELVGDTAYKNNLSIQSVGDVFGRAYALIRDGEPLGRATMMMRNMGMVSPAVVAQLEEMQKAGAKSSDIWNALTGALEKNRGAMDTSLDTGQGLIDAIGGTWSQSVRDFGGAFVEFAKTELAYVLRRLQALRDSGAIKEWAEQALEKIKPLVEAFGNLFDGESRKITIELAGDAFKATWKWAMDSLANAFVYGGTVLALSIQKGLMPFNAFDINRSIATAGDDFRMMQNANNRLLSTTVTRIKEENERAANKRKAGDEEAEKEKEKARKMGGKRGRGYVSPENQAIAEALDDGVDLDEDFQKSITKTIVDGYADMEKEVEDSIKAIEKTIVDGEKRIEEANAGSKKLVKGDLDESLKKIKAGKEREKAERSMETRISEARRLDGTRGVRISESMKELIRMDDQRIQNERNAMIAEGEKLLNEGRLLDAQKERDKIAKDSKEFLKTIARTLDKAIQVGK